MLFDVALLFREHITKTVSRCRRTLAVTLKISRKLKSLFHFRLLYLSLVRSRAVYGCLIWGGCSACHLACVERIQRKFVEYCHTVFLGHVDYNYVTILDTLNLPQLTHFRKLLDIKFVYKLLHNIIPSSDLLSKLNFSVPRGLRHTSTFYNPRISLNPINRMQETCNGFDFDLFSITLKDIR